MSHQLLFFGQNTLCICLVCFIIIFKLYQTNKITFSHRPKTLFFRFPKIRLKSFSIKNYHYVWQSYKQVPSNIFYKNLLIIFHIFHRTNLLNISVNYQKLSLFHSWIHYPDIILNNQQFVQTKLEHISNIQSEIWCPIIRNFLWFLIHRNSK